MPRRRPTLITPAFLVIASATLAYFISAGITLPAVPLYVEGPLEGTAVDVGVVVAAFSVTALLLRPWAGRLTDTAGRRFTMLLGAGLVGVSMLGYAVSTSLPMIVGMRLLTGAGEGFFFVGAFAAATDLAPEERRGEAVSFFTLALYAGVGIGPIIGEAVIDGLGFTAVWVVAGGAAFLAALLAAWVPDTRPAGVHESGSVRLIHRSGLLPGVILLTALWGMAAYFAFLPLYAPRLGLEGSRFVFLVFSVVVLLVRSFGARIPDLLGARRSSAGALIFGAVGLVALGIWASPLGLYVGTVVFAFGTALAFPALTVLTVNRVPEGERGAVLGTFTAAVEVAFGLGPPTAGFFVSASGFRAAFLAAAAVAGIGLVVLTRSHIGKAQGRSVRRRT